MKLIQIQRSRDIKRHNAILIGVSDHEYTPASACRTFPIVGPYLVYTLATPKAVALINGFYHDGSAESSTSPGFQRSIIRV